METFRTPGGKTIELFHEGFSLRAKFTTGGQLPPELAGIWTSFTQAKTSIETYITKLKAKKTKE